MENMIITCIQCGAEFDFSIDDQIRHREMKFDNPKRCPACRKHKSKLKDDQDRKFNHRKKSYQTRSEY